MLTVMVGKIAVKFHVFEMPDVHPMFIQLATLHEYFPKPRGIPSSACSGTFGLENPVQMAESLISCPALTAQLGVVGFKFTRS